MKNIPIDILLYITSFQSSKDTVFLIENPIKYVGKYIANKSDTDDIFKNYNFRYLTNLDCNTNKNFTDEIFKCLPNLTKLYCSSNTKLTDEIFKCK
jgi:Leucine-rich repeat (LRR) protein